jgi:hypothetical protein
MIWSRRAAAFCTSAEETGWRPDAGWLPANARLLRSNSEKAGESWFAGTEASEVELGSATASNCTGTIAVGAAEGLDPLIDSGSQAVTTTSTMAKSGSALLMRNIRPSWKRAEEIGAVSAPHDPVTPAV